MYEVFQSKTFNLEKLELNYWKKTIIDNFGNTIE